jgi:hypothetical protein
LDQTEKVRHVIYFPALAKPESAKIPNDKTNIQFIPLNKLEEQGNNAQIGFYYFHLFFFLKILFFR